MTLSPLVVALILAASSAFGSTADVEALLRKGDLARAAITAAEEARARPTDVEIQELYVDLLVATGMQPRAEMEARARVVAQPKDASAHYLLGRAVADGASAQSAYEAALKIDPGFARAYMGLGAVYESRAQIPQAESAYGRAVSKDPSLSEAWLGRIRMSVRAGRTVDALGHARNGLAAIPDEPGLALALAELAPTEAERVLAAAMAEVPDDPRLHEAMAGRLLARGDAPGALREATAALKIDPSAPLATRILWFAREQRDARLDTAGRAALDAATTRQAVDPKGSVPAWDALVARYPRSAMVKLGRGLARRASGDAAGIDDLVSAVMLDPENLEVLGVAGIALVGAERAEEAEPLLGAAASARPWDASVGLAWVRSLVLLGRRDEARTVSGDLAARFPLDAAVQVTHAGSLLDAGQNEEAYRVVKAGLLMIPDPRLAAAFVRIAPLVGRPEEAAALLDQIVAKTGNTALAEAARKLRQPGP